MKISLITSTFNSSKTLRDTMDSVRSQSYSNLEYIIVDGGSTDETMDIVQSYDDIVSISISEPDNGIYDALNKGIYMASGDVVGFLHSDDLYAHSEVLSTVAEAFQEESVDALYADLDYVDREDPTRIFRKWRSRPWEKGLFRKGWMPAHPTFYMRKKHYEAYGAHDTSFKQSADYELMLRMLERYELTPVYVPDVFVKMRVGGLSNASFSHRWKANKEDAMAWKKNGLKPSVLTRFLKPLSKVTQFLQKD